MMPPEAAEVSSNPDKRKTRNRTMPVKAWRARILRSLLIIRGSPRWALQVRGSKTSKAIKRLPAAVRKTGSLKIRSLPTTTELPAMAMAAARHR
jgi:hypothetical protein